MSAYEGERAREAAEAEVVRRVASDYLGEAASPSYCDGFRKFLGFLKAGDRLPGGLMVVPEEPTGEQLSAGGAAMVRHRFVGFIYRAMVGAAGRNADLNDVEAAP